MLGHTSFEASAFDRAEKQYAEVLKLTPERDAARNDLVERQAAAIYKQGEQARAAGQTRDAVDHFARVATVAPQSTVRAAAQYDASASLIVLKDWDGAIRTLEDFRTRFPNHALQGEVSGKLAVAYLEKGQWAGAAGEFERLAASQPRPEDRPRRALAGRRAVREGRLAAERDQGLRALPGASTRSRSSPRSRRAGGCRGSPRPTATPRARRR